jgi:hypothetical protein
MARKRRARSRDPDNDMHSVESFCHSNGISIGLYYKLRGQGKGPRETRVGRRVLISPEAEADWRREREA